MILDDIKTKLLDIDPNTFYGVVDESMREMIWDYIVFNRKSMKPSANKTGYTDKFTVHIVREEYVPDGLAEEVIEKMCEIAGMRLADGEAEYDYTTKPSTDKIVEMISIDFVKARKKVK